MMLPGMIQEAGSKERTDYTYGNYGSTDPLIRNSPARNSDRHFPGSKKFRICYTEVAM